MNQHNPVQPSTTQYNPAQLCITQYDPAQPSTTHHHPVQPCITQYNPAQPTTTSLFQEQCLWQIYQPLSPPAALQRLAQVSPEPQKQQLGVPGQSLGVQLQLCSLPSTSWLGWEVIAGTSQPEPCIQELQGDEKGGALRALDVILC